LQYADQWSNFDQPSAVAAAALLLALINRFTVFVGWAPFSIQYVTRLSFKLISAGFLVGL
jgi:hypothetical protein